MYRLLEYDAGNRLNSTVDCYDKAITLCGVSKSFSVPGLRIGWIASHDKGVMKRLAELKDYVRASVILQSLLIYLALDLGD